MEIKNTNGKIYNNNKVTSTHSFTPKTEKEGTEGNKTQEKKENDSHVMSSYSFHTIIHLNLQTKKYETNIKTYQPILTTTYSVY